MDQLNPSLIKERSRRASELVDKISLEKNKLWIGKECEILISEKGKEFPSDRKGTEKSQWIGRNESYKPVVIEGNNLFGKFLKVKIVDAKKSCLIGEVV
jgi:tRNA A37 methylthiotransferase MiaB